MYALDTNLLVYAHNVDAPFHEAAKAFIEKVMNERDDEGKLAVCIPAQVLIEFINVITWTKLESPLSLPEALQIVQQYLDTGVTIVHPLPSQLNTLLELFANVQTRKKVFDTALAATLRDNGISGLYTLNVKDFVCFEFLGVVNPLA
ncbi:PIN domain-containing protein [Candidatus Thiothrix sp. Deng01]|uniref:Ribonuclease VapC n=1 Tax=Candidatus Thiothrix phosphatis TaxID=3112415 RepID=A0ABU6D098_9GAMM|nr:PIN domain-containing protein [Candidatus Thiothrix sp. Deng01]MEB4592510.1 PIN domain-containing protein [Candidatus Thiothrix sp. Deng01]